MSEPSINDRINEILDDPIDVALNGRPYVEALRGVLREHRVVEQPVVGHAPRRCCKTCGYNSMTVWPCATVQALANAFGIVMSPRNGVLPTAKIRVSCAAIIRVRLHDGSFVLLDTRGAELGPPGGAIKYYLEAAGFLARLGWEPQRTPDEQGRTDLRGFLPEDSLPAFLEWLDAGTGRETGEECALRELGEELVESGQRDLAAYVPAAVRLSYVRTCVEGPAAVDGHVYRQLRRFDVYELATDGLGGLHRQLSLRAADPETRSVVAVSEDDIARGRLGDSLIGTQAAYLVSAGRKAEERASALRELPGGER